MNLHLTGHHLEVTPALREYIETKLAKLSNHFDHMIDVKVTIHVPGADLHAESSDADMYSAIDLLADKLDRQVLKHKEKNADHHKTNGAVKHQATE
jgi:putative sigma-54 modulation protein